MKCRLYQVDLLLLLQVSSELGETKSYIKHFNCNERCPSECLSEWNVYEKINGRWKIDENLIVSCGKNTWLE